MARGIEEGGIEEGVRVSTTTHLDVYTSNVSSAKELYVVSVLVPVHTHTHNTHTHTHTLSLSLSPLSHLLPLSVSLTHTVTHNGLKSTEVSSPASHSNTNLRSANRRIFFLFFSAPKYRP